MIDTTQISANIKTLIKAKGMTNEQVAAACMVSSNSVRRWKNGSRMPSIDNLVLLAEMLDVTIDDIIGTTKN